MFPQKGARTGGLMGWRRRLQEEKHSGDQRPSPEGAQMQARCSKPVETQWAPWLLCHDFHPCGHEGYWVISLRLLRVTSGLWKHGCRRLGLKGGLDNPPSWTEGFLEQTTRLGDTCLVHRPRPAPPSGEGSAKNAEGTSRGCDFRFLSWQKSSLANFTWCY